MATQTVQTVTGPVDAGDLGRTLVHEHIRISYAGEEYDRNYSQWSRADTVELAVDKLGELLDAGFRTFVDPCPIELGRDPELYAEVAQRSGMNIVCTTGFYTEHLGWGLPTYWRARDPEEIAEHYVAELTEGILGTGGIRPGAIKAATGLEVTDAERRVLTGAGLAQHETGVPIITHTENSRNGDVQQDIFESAGADLGRVLIGHQDEQEEVAPIRKLAERGTFVGIDRIGLEILAPDPRRADHVATLVREGYTSQVCLSQDHICSMTAPRSPMWTPPEMRARRAELAEAIAWQVTKRPYTYVWTDFAPMLRERGVTDADLETIFVDNPRRLLSGT
jgi:phosphotriesterase-related protein